MQSIIITNRVVIECLRSHSNAKANAQFFSNANANAVLYEYIRMRMRMFIGRIRMRMRMFLVRIRMRIRMIIGRIMFTCDYVHMHILLCSPACMYILIGITNNTFINCTE